MKQCKRRDHDGLNPVPFDEFGLNARQSDGYDYYCKKCRALYHKQLYERQRTKIIQRVSEWQKNNPIAVQSTSKRYRQRNPEQRQKSGKMWRDENLEVSCHLANKRRANKLSATPTWFENEEVAQLAYSCATGYHIHHIVPLQEDPLVCGLHCLANLSVVSKEEHVRIHSSLDTLRAQY